MTKHETTATSLALVVIVLACFALVAIAGCSTTRQSCEVGATYDGSSPVVVATYKMEVR